MIMFYFNGYFFLPTHLQGLCKKLNNKTIRDFKKTYKRASNASVNLDLPWVKSVPNFTLFYCESEFCCDLAFLWGICMAFNMLNS